MRFVTFDFDRSSYANAKASIKNNLTYATGKAWVWKKNFPLIAGATTYPIEPTEEQYMVPSNVESIVYPNTKWEYNTDIVDTALFNTIPQNNVYGITTLNQGVEQMLSSTQMYSFIKKYKIKNSASGIKNSDNTWMTVEDARLLMIDLKTDIEADLESFATFVYRLSHHDYIRKTARRNSINYYVNGELNRFLPSKAGYEYELLRVHNSSSYSIMTGIDSHINKISTLMQPIGAVVIEWTEHFDLPDDDEARATYAAIEYVVNKIATYFNTTVYAHTFTDVFGLDQYSIGNTRLIKIPQDVLMTIINDSIAYYDDLISSNQSTILDAQETALGEVLEKFDALEDIVSMDLNNVNEVLLSFRLSVNHDTNKLEDKQDATKMSVIYELEDIIPEWRDYCFIRYDKVFTGTQLDPEWEHREYLYILDWNKIKNLNNYKFMVLLQAFMTLDVGAPNKKYSLGDYIGLIAMVVVAVVMAIPTGGGSTAWLVAYMTMAGATIMAIGMYIGNDHLMKIGQGIMTMASVVSITSGATSGKKFTTFESIQYALQVSNMALGEYRKRRSISWQQEFNELSEEIEEVSELITPFDKMNKVQRFIHGDDLKTPREISFDDLFITPYDMYYKL